MNCAGQPIFAQLIYLSCASAIGRAACRDMWTVRRERLCTFIYLSLDPSLSAGLRAGFRATGVQGTLSTCNLFSDSEFFKD